MENFATFTPIITQRAEMLKYYEDNELPLPKNPFFKKEFSELVDSREKIDNTSVVEFPPLISFRDKTALKRIKQSTEKQNSLEIKKLEENSTPIKKEEKKEPVYSNEIQEEIYTLPISEEDKIYLDTLAKGESTYNPTIENSLGYYGLYQFGEDAFKAVNSSKEAFSKDTILQHESALKLKELNKKYLNNYLKNHNAPDKSIDDLIGKTIKGHTLTENKIAGAMHHMGAKTFFDWLYDTKNTDLAKKGFKDRYGASIERYLKRY
ncbi:MAG: hypothetical protein PF569_08515 [Candidatus Woesearchaeota archaeon]|jgi:hypothetical protein|nr:hypothetical protein [Candidatus Woesearchaeota archaeon]